jgi:hypothetical protein
MLAFGISIPLVVAFIVTHIKDLRGESYTPKHASKYTDAAAA